MTLSKLKKKSKYYAGYGCEKAYDSLYRKAITDCDSNNALQILHWCSILNPDYIQIPFLIDLTKLSRERLNRGMEKLLNFSLVKRSGNPVSIHQGIQNEVQCIMQESELHDCIEKLGLYLKSKLSEIIKGFYAFSEKKDAIMHAQWMLSFIGKNSSFLDKDTRCSLHEIVGEYQLRRGNINTAKEHLMQVCEKGENREVHTINCLAMALLYESEGCYSEALEMLVNVKRFEGLLIENFPVRYFEMKLVETYLYDDMQVVKKAIQAEKEAEKLLEQCEHKLEEAEVIEHRLNLINVKGHTLLLRGNEAGAEEQYQRVISMCNKKFGRDNEKVPAYAHALSNLGYVNIQTSGDNEIAIQYFLKAKEILSQLYGCIDHPDFAILLNGLGWSYMNQSGEGGEEKASQYFQEALDILNNLKMYEHPLGAQVCMMQASLAWRRGQFKQVVKFCNQGLEIADCALSSDEKAKLIYSLLMFKIPAYCLMGHYESAKQDWKESKRFLAEMKRLQAISFWCKTQCLLLTIPFIKLLKKIKKEK